MLPQVDPKSTFWFGVWTNILILIAGYGVQHAPTYVAIYAPDVQWFAGLFAQINGLVLTALAGISSTKPGPLISLPPVPSAAKMILAFWLVPIAFVIMLVLTAASPARAGDIASPVVPLPPVKAINYTPCQAATAATATTAATPLSCTGGYIGGGIGGEGSNANIIGNGINGSVFAGGITPTFDAGYQYVQGNWMAAAELDVGYAVGTGATVNGVGNGFNGFRISEVFKVGGNLSGLLGTQTPITIPPQLANSVLAPYVHVGTTQWQLRGAWANGISSGAGVLFDISPRIFGDLRYTYTNFSAARSGGLTINDDNSILATINFKLN